MRQTDSLLADSDRDALIAAMAQGGQRLAVKWGHPPWSESWARLVATTMLDASLDGVAKALVATDPDATIGDGDEHPADFVARDLGGKG